MENLKLFDAELKLMELVWDQPGASAKHLSLLAKERIGWNKNTTYTVLNKLIAKGAIERREPGFVCVPRVTREQVATAETEGLLDRFYRGSAGQLLASFVRDKRLSEAELTELGELIRRAREE